MCPCLSELPSAHCVTVQCCSDPHKPGCPQQAEMCLITLQPSCRQAEHWGVAQLCWPEGWIVVDPHREKGNEPNWGELVPGCHTFQKDRGECEKNRAVCAFQKLSEIAGSSLQLQGAEMKRSWCSEGPAAPGVWVPRASESCTLSPADTQNPSVPSVMLHYYPEVAELTPPSWLRVDAFFYRNTWGCCVVYPCLVSPSPGWFWAWLPWVTCFPHCLLEKLSLLMKSEK